MSIFTWITSATKYSNPRGLKWRKRKITCSKICLFVPYILQMPFIICELISSYVSKYKRSFIVTPDVNARGDYVSYKWETIDGNCLLWGRTVCDVTLSLRPRRANFQWQAEEEARWSFPLNLPKYQQIKTMATETAEAQPSTSSAADKYVEFHDCNSV